MGRRSSAGCLNSVRLEEFEGEVVVCLVVIVVLVIVLVRVLVVVIVRRPLLLPPPPYPNAEKGHCVLRKPSKFLPVHTRRHL